jgi:hypothetical protein
MVNGPYTFDDAPGIKWRRLAVIAGFALAAAGAWKLSG